DYWVPGLEGVQQLTPNPDVYDNPYFLAYEVNNSFARDRVFGNIKADWEIAPFLRLMGRYSLDKFNETRESKIGPSYSRERNNGAYGLQELGNYEQNIDFLLTFNKQVSDFGINLSAGGNYLYIFGSSITNASKPSAGLIVPNVYSIGNIQSGALDYNSIKSQKGIYSLYGMANLSYADMIYLDLTARNDWSSTLPKENQSYFYPSASLSLIVNEMFDMGKSVDLVKLRGGLATVGNDANPYQLFPIYGNSGQWGNAIRLSKSGTILTPNLKPELATSWEVGTDIRLFENRLRVEATYYEVANRNQIIRNIPIASSSGFDRVNINAGLISSKGWEILLGVTPLRTNNFTWDLNANFTRNRTRLDELADGIDLVQFWEDAKGGAWTYVGDEIGDIYDAEIRRVEDESSPYYQYPILNTGSFEWDEIEITDAKNKVGNYNPDFIVGIQNAFAYKNFRLAFTLDWRK
ncbi:MAG: TonB-dependent receptor, partial [Bacteroidetes bacterium]|nr:TonB-dependent receptor [Bacteroidota bacterium]